MIYSLQIDSAGTELETSLLGEGSDTWRPKRWTPKLLDGMYHNP